MRDSERLRRQKMMKRLRFEVMVIFLIIALCVGCVYIRYKVQRERFPNEPWWSLFR